MRLRNNPNAMNELNESKYFVDSFPIKIKKNTILEFGMGKGEMITTLASKNSNVDFIGVEKYPTVANIARRKADELELNNFQIIVEDLKEINQILKGRADVIWLTFSDPWPKARHEKRRLTHIDFLNRYKKLLTKDGVLKFKTDNDKLFEWTIEHMNEHRIKLDIVTRDFHVHKSSKGNIMTGYESKWSSLGKKINYLETRFIEMSK
ncbi:MAG: tRNA (guanosine(46)-N7)-methyltransferase TrmB [Mycoplasmataceae bacterium]|nr:tRNA (guanosine(46)-N7)-methyltransferase TrmB [Mycoplasmataceae bacterium]